MIRVNYNGLIVDIQEEDLKEVLAFLSSESPPSRKKIVQSVETTLQKILSLVEKGKPLSKQAMQNTSNDVGIWFANETLEGRAEQYKAMMQ
jgi:ClpP class serine protease